MVDTARTADYLKSKLTAQALRDLIESLVDPVPGGGFNPIQYAMVEIETNGQTFSDGSNFYAVDYSDVSRTVVDEPGWVQDAPYTSPWYGDEYQAYSWMLLPPGIYKYNCTQSLDVTIASGVGNSSYMDVLDDPAPLGNVAMYDGWTVYTVPPQVGAIIYGAGYFIAGEDGARVGHITTVDDDDVPADHTYSRMVIFRVG